MTLSDRIIAARQARGWSQKTLAEVLESMHVMTQQSLSALESGKSRSSRHIWDLAAILGVNARWLAMGEGQMDDSVSGNGMPLPPASDQLMPLMAKLYALDQAGQLPQPVIEGLIRLLDGLQPNGQD